MRYHVLATDYDGTLAKDGRVGEQTIAALTRLRQSGRRLVLVTGRLLDDLRQAFPQIDMFDRIVAENGALLYRPDTREETVLSDSPPPAFAEELRNRGVPGLGIGRVIVGTWRPHETTVLEVIRDQGLELEIIFNKNAVMVLPSGVNKATGLRAALKSMSLSPHNSVGVGDAENDHAFLALCECSVAVANALPTLKQRADLVTTSDHGGGVEELIDRLLADDLTFLESTLARHRILLGWRDGEAEERIDPYRPCILLAGTSGGGKSTFATGFMERLADAGYQFCMFDPEGDYDEFARSVAIGSIDRPPNIDHALELLARPRQNVSLNLTGIDLDRRSAFFESFFLRLMELRARVGRPHWIIIDETHHLMPRDWSQARNILPRELNGAMLITVHPEHVCADTLKLVDTALTLGKSPEQAMASFAQLAGHVLPLLGPVSLRRGELLLWRWRTGGQPFLLHGEPPRAELRRHLRKYAQGALADQESFYFHGPDGRLNLRAQNLTTFIQMAEGVDDATWEYHLRHGDYSRWFFGAIGNKDLARDAEAVEQDADLSPAESRALIMSAIKKRYTAAA